MKKHLSTIILILIFFVGLSLLLYPTVSDYWNSFHQSQAIAGYVETIANIDEDKYEKIFNDAKAYNEKLASHSSHWRLSEEEEKEYNNTLNISDIGIIGYIEIPKINCSLPIYHGTDENVLQIAVGHIAGSSLPIGGESTHSVLSGHRGLPSAKLFTNLDKLENGDLFMIRVMDETLTYKVDQILIVEPDDFSALGIEDGQDLCTLITCTPYGINTHRLLVRGHRVDNVKQTSDIRVTADAIQIEPVLVAPIVAVPIVIVLFVIILLSRRKSVKCISIGNIK
ncbi:MAG: class C sortase [Acutalibacteraceae bacterium]|nr:class C sortase [Acutalibacteraceae bacterium]